MPFSGFFRVQKVVVAQLPGGEAINRFIVAQRFGKRREQECDGCQTLLSVYDKQGRLMRNLG